jgi:outer membrane protein assembly factor BamB
MMIPFALLLAACDDWPSWRGPSRDGVSAERDLPAEWGPEKNVLWKFPLPGSGGATPVVAAGAVYVLSPDASGDRLLLYALGLDGAQRWIHTVTTGLKGVKNNASASPVTDGKHVWVHALDGILVCVAADGKESWRVDLQKRYGRYRIAFGMTSTPVLHEGILYLQLIHSGGACVVALDAADGRERWKAARSSDGVQECEHSYASLQLWTSGAEALLVSHGNDYAVGHDLKDGAERWRLGDLNPKESYNKTLRFVSSPVCTPGLIVVPTAKKGQVVAVDPRASGRIDRVETKHQRWRVASGTPDVASPLVYDGLVYLADTDGTVACHDAASGERLYRERSAKGGHYASPAAGDGKVYLAGRGGPVLVLAAGRTFKPLATNDLGDPIDASPAISSGRLYLRGAKHLWAVGTR